jgi:hypothetical protein
MGAYVTTTGFNAAKVFLAGGAVGVFLFEGFNLLTRESRGLPLSTPAPYSCTADPEGAAGRPCKCTECGMRPGRSELGPR